MSQWERIPFNGRDIYLVTGSVSQTVNVCTEKNLRGDYEWIIRVTTEPFLTRADILTRASIEDLVRWFEREKGGKIERRPGRLDKEKIKFLDEGADRPTPAVRPAPAGDSGSTAAPSEKIGLDESEWRDDASSLADWEAWIKTIEPLEFTLEEASRIAEFDEQMRQYNVEAVRRQMQQGACG